MWDDYHVFLIATLVFTRLLLDEIYHLIELPFEWLIDDAMFVCLLDELILGFCYSNLTLETGGFELASSITLVLQANRLTKCAIKSLLIKTFWKVTIAILMVLRSVARCGIIGVKATRVVAWFPSPQNRILLVDAKEEKFCILSGSLVWRKSTHRRYNSSDIPIVLLQSIDKIWVKELGIITIGMSLCKLQSLTVHVIL